MNRPIACLLAVLLTSALPPGAAAQPLVLPGAQLPEIGAAAPAARPQPQPQPRPAAAKAVTEEAILGRTLRRSGRSGAIRVERAGRSGLRARIALQGTRLSRPGEVCTLDMAEPVPMTARGRSEGLARYEIQIPACPIEADLLDGGLWVHAGGSCTMEPEDCRIETAGLWGPEPAVLAPQARRIEQERGAADRAVRENYKVLTQRTDPQEVRAIVSEQAAFSSEREMACRSYAGEASHGFCNARFTERRAARLAARLGIAPPGKPAATPPGAGVTPAERPAPRRPAPIRPPPPSLLTNPG